MDRGAGRTSDGRARARQSPAGSHLCVRRAPCDLRTGLHLTGHQTLVRGTLPGRRQEIALPTL